MKPLSYYSRLRLKRFGLLVLALILIVIALAVCFFVYLGRYLVYTDSGAYLSFLHSEQETNFAQEEPDAVSFLPVQYGPFGVAKRPQADAEEEAGNVIAQVAVRGVYLSYRDLYNTQACLDAVHSTEDCNTVMLYLRSSSGYDYFDSTIPGSQTADIDISAVSDLVRTLQAENYYLIARIPAFPNTSFALEHISSGLQISNGALWMDADGYYWLDPASSEVQQYLCSTAAEIAALGFDEIAFADFTYPVSPNIVYGDLDAEAQKQVLSSVSSQLIDLGATLDFAVSFCDPSDDTPSPSANGHLFLSGVEGSDVSASADQYRRLIHDNTSLIFLTDSRDTRFQPFGILRTSSQE